MLVSIIIAVFEFSWKRRKLAVDENVREFKHMEMYFTLLTINFRNPCFMRCGKTSSLPLIGEQEILNQSSQARLRAGWAPGLYCPNLMLTPSTNMASFQKTPRVVGVI